MYIKDGIPSKLGINTFERYKSFFNPILETKIDYCLNKFWDYSKLNLDKVNLKIVNYYNHLIEKGEYFSSRYGDWIKLSKLEINENVFLNLDCILQNSWPKPTLAADLGIFVRTKQKLFFIGIIRGNEPGKGKAAILGGIRNVGNVLDSAAYTVIKESREESGLNLNYNGDLERLRENYSIKSFEVEVLGFEKLLEGNKTIKATLDYIDSIKTPESERNLDGTKRVYETTTFALLIDLKKYSLKIQKPILKEDLLKIFKAGDDAADLYIQDISDIINEKTLEGVPKFGLEHHLGLFKKMVNLLFMKKRIIFK